MKQTNLDIRRVNDCAIASCGNDELSLSQWVLLLDTVDRLDCGTVIDASEVTGTLTEIEAYLLALRADEKTNLRRHRIAVVKTDESLAELDFFVLSARNLGLNIKSFANVDAATTWAGQRNGG